MAKVLKRAEDVRSNRSVTTTPGADTDEPALKAGQRHLVGLPAGKRNPIAFPEPAGKPSTTRPNSVDDDQISIPDKNSELSDLEWAVVELSLRDSFRSTALPSWRTQLSDIILGRGSINRLADPRLEGLRVYAVLLRSGNIAAILKAKGRITQLGFTESQAKAVEALVESRAPRSDVG